VVQVDAPEQPLGTVERETFRHVVGHFPSGVTVITAVDEDGTRYGVTASAVASLSLDPPMLLVSLNSRLRIRDVIARTGHFGVNVLGEDDGELASRFASRVEDRFAGLEVRTGRAGSPLLTRALAAFDCVVEKHVEAGTHTVFLALVVEAYARGGTPLTYWRGGFGAFSPAEDERAVDQVRQAILDHDLGLDDHIRPDELAERLALPPTSVHAALSRLLQRQLVESSDGDFRIAPLTPETSDAVFDAQQSLESGVITGLPGPVQGRQLDHLRRLAEATVPLVEDGRITDSAAYEQANHAFHAGVIGLAHNPYLDDAYARLAVPDVIARATARSPEADPGLAGDHLDLVEALAAGDQDAALAVERAHAERAKGNQRRALGA
jgi:flavin reductase (DIM6/NTAB) family NADH-FMN oxidoreductase RutF/DNA-binding GntR family transcriptional regulator